VNSEHDFSRSPRQRQRRREVRFYCALGSAAAFAVAAVMLHGCTIGRDSARLQAATRMLQTELQQLQSQLKQVQALETEIVTQRQHLDLQFAQATQRTFAPLALHALATISPAHIRLHQVTVRNDTAEIRGAAGGQQQLQELVDTLKRSGLGQVRLKEMQQGGPPAHPGNPPLRYSFTLMLSAAQAQAPAPAPAPAPSPPINGEAGPAQHAKRT
jgi:Tfp pilus assembly protein PilN